MSLFSIRNPSRVNCDPEVPTGTWALFGGIIALLLGSAAAWITHVIVCIKASAWILLLFGCIVAPVGVIHGIGVWLGVF